MLIRRPLDVDLIKVAAARRFIVERWTLSL